MFYKGSLESYDEICSDIYRASEIGILGKFMKYYSVFYEALSRIPILLTSDAFLDMGIAFSVQPVVAIDKR